MRQAEVCHMFVSGEVKKYRYTIFQHLRFAAKHIIQTKDRQNTYLQFCVKTVQFWYENIVQCAC